MENSNCKHSHDCDGEPRVADIRKAAIKNTNFRSVFWTGDKLQTVLMSIPVGCDIGVEIHEDTDQILYIEAGTAKFIYGCSKHTLCNDECANAGEIICVPCGTWHNIINTGNTPLKLFTVYAPPHHCKRAVEPTKE